MATSYRALKSKIHAGLNSPNWQEFVNKLPDFGEQESFGPLLSLLPRGGEIRQRAIIGIGIVISSLAKKNMEAARIAMRRLMWHMNEESGNIGWGIPESMAEIMVCSQPLSKEFSRILLSYIMDTGHEDNYIDHLPLLREAYSAAGRLAAMRPELVLPALPALINGLSIAEPQVNGQAALALFKLLSGTVGKPELLSQINLDLLIQAREKLHPLLQLSTPCETFTDNKLRYVTVGELSELALKTIKRLQDINN